MVTAAPTFNRMMNRLAVLFVLLAMGIVAGRFVPRALADAIVCKLGCISTRYTERVNSSGSAYWVDWTIACYGNFYAPIPIGANVNGMFANPAPTLFVYPQGNTTCILGPPFDPNPNYVASGLMGTGIGPWSANCYTGCTL
jgi:hypothetical protein